ncbi:unnamed protein product [Heterobilharzia americana]|nr:unnamed protein product [Heterobilharzia americana]
MTSEDLNGSLETPPSIGSKTVYIKPLPSEYDMLSSSLVNEKRFPKPEKSALLPFTSSSDDLIPLTSAAFSPTSVHNIKTSKDNDTNNSNLEVIPSSYPSSYSPTEVNYDHVTDKRDYNTSHTITPPQSITSNHEDQNSQRPHKQRRYPHHRHVNRNSFNRHSTLRRSLGGVTILSYANTSHKYSSDSDVSQKIDVSSEKTNGREVIVIKNDAKLTDYLSSPSRTSESINNSSDTVNYQRYVFRISDLPAWEDLGFLLKPFSSNRKIKPKFKGFRLANKSACTRQFPHLYYNGYNNIPFRSGDIIVSVNHHKLSNVSEAEALQYVYNAFTDAERQHTIEIGILRPSLSGNRSSRNSCIPTEPSTLPRNLMIRQKSDSGYSNSIEMTISPSNPHQPRRRTNHSSPEISPELLSLNTKGSGENNNRIMRNTKLSSLHRLSLMDYPDSPHLSTSSPRILSIDKFTTTPTTGGDANSYGGIGYRNSINTATLALSLSSNLTENGFITIRRPKHPTSLGTVDSGRHSISSATESIPPLVELKSISSTAGTGENSGSNLSNSRTLTPHMEEVKSPCISRSLNVSKKDPNAFNTRTIGQTMHIQLTKTRTNGLGFTLTSRDTQTQSSQISDPVYVKKILPDGAAIQDGRLMIGDRLLAIDGENVQSLNHVLSKLRSLEPGKQVDLLISRHASCNDADVNVRKALMPSRPFVTLTYEYYLPLDTSQPDSSRPPALGINFKWSNDILLSSSSSAEMSKITVDNELTPTPSSQYSPVPGLYIDSLLPGCIVTSDNRITLQPGDRLVGINGESVAGMNIKNIIKRLKRVLKHCHERNVHNAGQSSTSFSLTVHRYKDEENTQSSTGESVRPSDLPPRRIKSLQLEELENGHQTHHQHHRDKSNNLSGQTNSQENCSLSFTLSDNRRRLRIASSPTVQYPSPRNLSVPSNRNFLREGFGRRSVSEKRHGHVDASQFSFFQTNILPNRYKMPEDVDKQYSTMPTTRRLKMHKARLAAGAATNSQLPISVVGGGGQGLGGIAGSGSGPLKALHPSNGMPPQSPVNTSHQDPEEVDIELQLDQMPLSRNRKQNNSFRHAVDRSLFPTTTDNNISSNNYANTLNMKSLPKTCFESLDVNSPPPPPVPPYHPRSETSSHGKLGIGGCHKSSKAKISSPLPQPSSHSSSVSNTNHPERPRSKSRSEINSQTTLLFQDKSLHSSSNSTHLTTEQKQNKSD